MKPLSAEAQEILSRPQKAIWIPVIEMLPPYGQRVLFTRIYGYSESTRLIEVGTRDRTDFHGEWWHAAGDEKPRLSTPAGQPLTPDLYRVLAWMPLPEPFK